ncbi:hypothetical protein DW838_06335 [Dorea formicigenerans]|nr:hypothetical protein DW838_06335 [Dorea formicigenerans]
MKRKSASFLAGVLVASMVATPLSYTNVYAEDQDVAEIVQQVKIRLVSQKMYRKVRLQKRKAKKK